MMHHYASVFVEFAEGPVRPVVQRPQWMALSDDGCEQLLMEAKMEATVTAKLVRFNLLTTIT